MSFDNVFLCAIKFPSFHLKIKYFWYFKLNRHLTSNQTWSKAKPSFVSTTKIMKITSAKRILNSLQPTHRQPCFDVTKRLIALLCRASKNSQRKRETSNTSATIDVSDDYELQNEAFTKSRELRTCRSKTITLHFLFTIRGKKIYFASMKLVSNKLQLFQVFKLGDSAMVYWRWTVKSTGDGS